MKKHDQTNIFLQLREIQDDQLAFGPKLTRPYIQKINVWKILTCLTYTPFAVLLVVVYYCKKYYSKIIARKH